MSAERGAGGQTGEARLTDGQRAVLARLADVLVAEGRGMPAASAVGVAGDLMDRCLVAAPMLAEPLAALLDEASAALPGRGSADDADGATADDAGKAPGDEEPVDAAGNALVRDLAANRRADFGVLSTAVVGAYYLSGEVRDLVGYPGQEPSPLTVAAEPEYLDMLERVYERHPGYREAP